MKMHDISNIVQCYLYLYRIKCSFFGVCLNPVWLVCGSSRNMFFSKMAIFLYKVADPCYSLSGKILTTVTQYRLRKLKKRSMATKHKPNAFI